MANYYYGRVRTFTTPYTVNTLTDDNLKTQVKTNPVQSYDKYKVWYVIDVHKTSESSFSKWSASTNKGPLVAGNNKRVSLNKNSSNLSIVTGSIVYWNSHLVFSIYRNTGANPTNSNAQLTCTPTISITQSEETGSDVVVTNILWENKAKVAPTIVFSQKAGDPTYNTNAIDAWRKEKYGAKYNSFSSIKDRFFYQCDNKWYVLINEINRVPSLVSLWKFDKDGGNPTQAVTPRKITNDATAKSWNDQNLKIFHTVVKDKTCSAGSGSGSGDITDVDRKPPTEYLRWNPPPHAASRSIPYGIKTKGLLDKNGQVINGSFSDILIAGNYIPRYAVETEKGYSYLERGRIFQDKISASIMNTTKISIPAGSTTAKQWGFRFMYNPTTISYTTAANNSIDWTMGSKDQAALLTGNQTVTFQLYINRIVDMSYLSEVNPTSNMDSAYGRGLEGEERAGILRRGTEYDIEFLYRTLTGDPIKNNPLLNPAYKGVSADIGYITGIPLWLHLNDNLRYYGAVTSLGVNHVIFNTEMVPMLSVIDISFSRYPAYGTGGNTTKVKDIYDTLNTTEGGTT
jgi:hypothetical protein